MINRILGWIFTLAVLAAVVFAALNWGGYSSMCFGGDSEESVAVEQPTVVEAEGENENEELVDEPLNIEVEDSEAVVETTESTL